MNSEIPRDSPIMNIDPAEPSRTPARPNKPLNITIGTVAGIFLGAMAGGGAVAISQFKNRSRISPRGPD